jgi:hypothetical protein
MGLLRDLPVGREHTERNVLVENREVPILHELPSSLETGAFVCPGQFSGQTKTFSLCDLCVSVVNELISCAAYNYPSGGGSGFPSAGLVA